MTKEEFQQRLQNEEDWAPGWDAIEKQFQKVYGSQEPTHYGTNMAARAMFGGDQYLDGYSIYTSEKGYKHIVTFGMTELYADENCLGKEWNKWGYEMTIKLAESQNEECLWAIDMLANLARYTYTQERYFEPFQFIAGNGTSLHVGTESQITALMTIYDTEIESTDTLYGKVEFIQLVGITESELKALKDNRENAKKLYEFMKKDNPDFVLDMNRQYSYL